MSDIESELRIMEITDIPIVQLINHAYLLEKYPLDYFLTHLLLAKNELNLLYVINNKIVGYILTADNEDTVEIISICVMSQYRSRGVGTALMKAVMNRIHDKDIILYCRPGNLSAIRLYEYLGFIIEEKIENYYGPNSFAYLLRYTQKQ